MWRLTQDVSLFDSLPHGDPVSTPAAIVPRHNAALLGALVAEAALPSHPLQNCRSVAARLSTKEDWEARTARRRRKPVMRYFTSDTSAAVFHRAQMYNPAAGYAAVWNAGAEAFITSACAPVIGELAGALPDTAAGLMIVTHPDDELIFGGQLLLTAPPRTWVVAVATYDGSRKLHCLCARLQLAACVHLPHADAFTSAWDNRLVRDLSALVTARAWGSIVTHSPSGEYGHAQHRSLSHIVTTLVRHANLATGREVPLSYFSDRREDASGDNRTALNLARRNAVVALYAHAGVDVGQYMPMIRAYGGVRPAQLFPEEGGSHSLIQPSSTSSPAPADHPEEGLAETSHQGVTADAQGSASSDFGRSRGSAAASRSRDSQPLRGRVRPPKISSRVLCNTPDAPTLALELDMYTYRP